MHILDLQVQIDADRVTCTTRQRTWPELQI